MDPHAAHREEDAAWVAIETRAQIAEVQRFCARVERLFRINPYLQIRSWRALRPDVFEVGLRNLSNDLDQTFVISAFRPREDALRLVYDRGLKRSTAIELERCDRGTRVRITDDYSGTPESERRARVTEVDRSLTAWGIAFRSYLDREHRYGRFALWHALLDRVWLPMSASGRRIAIVLVVIAAAEIALTTVLALVIWLEGRGVS